MPSYVYTAPLSTAVRGSHKTSESLLPWTSNPTVSAQVALYEEVITLGLFIVSYVSYADMEDRRRRRFWHATHDCVAPYATIRRMAHIYLWPNLWSWKLIVCIDSHNLVLHRLLLCPSVNFDSRNIFHEAVQYYNFIRDACLQKHLFNSIIMCDMHV